MNILGICNTYFQLIAMIQLRLTLLKSDKVDFMRQLQETPIYVKSCHQALFMMR